MKVFALALFISVLSLSRASSCGDSAIPFSFEASFSLWKSVRLFKLKCCTQCESFSQPFLEDPIRLFLLCYLLLYTFKALFLYVCFEVHYFFSKFNANLNWIFYRLTVFIHQAPYQIEDIPSGFGKWPARVRLRKANMLRMDCWRQASVIKRSILSGKWCSRWIYQEVERSSSTTKWRG